MTQSLYDGCNVGDLVVTAISRGGDRVAFISDDTRWTYRQLGALISTVVQERLHVTDQVAETLDLLPGACLVCGQEVRLYIRLYIRCSLSKCCASTGAAIHVSSSLLTL